MKISGPASIRPATLRRSNRAADEGGEDFAAQLNAGEASTAAVTTAAPLTAVQSLLAIQEVPDATQNRRRAVKRGSDLLDQLDEIRLSLLTGTISLDRLKQLSRKLREPRSPGLDAKLAELMDDIELRVAVELAKLGH